MPSKKKKYNARFPAGRIKKIMQTDEEVGKVAQAVPVIISKALEMFIESLLKKSMHITQNRNAKTLTPSHMKQCILSESRFDFLKDLVKAIPDASVQEDNENNALADSNVNFGIIPDEPGTPVEARSPPKERRKDHSRSTTSNFYQEQSSSRASSTRRTPVIQFGPKVSMQENTKHNFPANSLASQLSDCQPYNIKEEIDEAEPKLHVTIASQELSNVPQTSAVNHTVTKSEPDIEVMPPLVPFTPSIYGQSSTGDNLCIDEDYDN